jgi:hypothetical protein
MLKGCGIRQGYTVVSQFPETTLLKGQRYLKVSCLKQQLYVILVKQISHNA